MMAQIAGFKRESVIDGPGIRAVVFFQGCRHHCPGCHNPETWDEAAGTDMTVEDIWRSLAVTPLVSGITFSGGEPFLQPAAALELVHKARSERMDVWIYTGYVWDQLFAHPDPLVRDLLAACDVLVDGPFRQNEKRLDLPYRGSANQRLISIPESLRTGAIVLFDPLQ
jgi:anaerobic ribonucleoside-triphosphate reductase activating protein